MPDQQEHYIERTRACWCGSVHVEATATLPPDQQEPVCQEPGCGLAEDAPCKQCKADELGPHIIPWPSAHASELDDAWRRICRHTHDFRPPQSPQEGSSEHAKEISPEDKHALDAYVRFISACGWSIPIPSEVFRAGYLAGHHDAWQDGVPS